MKARFLGEQAIPVTFQTDVCFMEALTAEHAVLDYEAVMSSKEFLRFWSRSSWPADDFTLEDNRQDLVLHAREHTGGLAYTYTILSAERKECIGCLYINPNERIQAVTAQERELLKQRPANARFWVRDSLRNTDKESIIMQELISWFIQTWKMDRILFTCNKKIPSQISLFENSGLHLWLELTKPGRHELLWSIP
jgi:hypothetical protein